MRNEDWALGVVAFIAGYYWMTHLGKSGKAY